MPSRIVEFFGYSPQDRSPEAANSRTQLNCPFLHRRCVKTLSDGVVSGVCTLGRQSGPVICCPIRLYAGDYQILRDVAEVAFGHGLPLVRGADVQEGQGACVAVFGKNWGKELRLPSRGRASGRAGAYFVDWILAHIGAGGELVEFVAVEVQSIDTTGNYRGEREAYLRGESFAGSSSAGFNWENVSKRILPQIIYKGHVLRQEPLCRRGLFFVCPSPVFGKIRERLGGDDDMRAYPLQPGALTFMWYDLGPLAQPGNIRTLNREGQFTTTIDQVALAFTAPRNLPQAGVYEQAIRSELSPR